MAVIDIKSNPTSTDLRVFAALWFVFFPLAGWWFVPGAPGLLVLAGGSLVCLLLSLALNDDFPRRSQWIGVAIPIVFFGWWSAGAAMRSAGAEVTTLRTWSMIACAAIGLLGAAAILISPALGTRLYRGWMFAVLPIGWTMAHLLLAIVFFLVVTPIGLVMRLVGRDPMERRFDRAATSYWKRRERVDDPERYLRQS